MLGLIWVAALSLSAETAKAETVTQRMFVEQMIEAAEAHCGAEWERVKTAPPSPLNRVDALQVLLDRADDTKRPLADDLNWPLPELEYRARAYIAVAGGDIGNFPVFLKFAKEVADSNAASDDLIAFAHDLRTRRAFEDCLKPSPAENIELLGSPEGLLSRDGACKREWDEGVDATIAYVLNTGDYSTVNNFAAEALAPFADCSEASR